MEKKDFRTELAENAKRLVRSGFGILAADESTGTIGKKFQAIGVENNEENRRRYRELLFTSEGIEKYISGVILFEEQTRQATKDGKKFVDLLNEKGILPGIKLDKGLVIIPGTQDEQATLGLDDLAKRAADFYAIGCRFAKWRNVIKITDTKPSALAIQEVAWTLARYAAICQENGLVPIVEPEILPEGPHTIERNQDVSHAVFAAVTKALHDNRVYLEGILLKPNMVTQGTEAATKASNVEIARRTVFTLSRTLPAAVPGVVFLSGGQSEEEATLNLNEMNKITDIPRPWGLSFSYGRALQNSAVKTWAGKEENFAAAQQAFLARAEANSLATQGKYVSKGGDAANENLHVKGYSY